MNSLLESEKKLNAKTNKLNNHLYHFFYGHLFPVIFAMIILLFWVANCDVVSYLLIIATGCFLFIKYRDITPIVPLVILIPMCFRSTWIFQSFIGYACFIPPLIALIVNLIRFPFRKVKFDTLSIAFIVVTVACLISGLFYGLEVNYTATISFTLITGIGMFAIHFFVSNRIEVKPSFNLKRYLVIAFLCAVNLACAQLIFAKVSNLLYPLAKPFETDNFCWANTNHIATLIIMAIPLCFYLMTNAKKLALTFVQLFVFCVCLVLADSDACILLALLFIPTLIGITYRHMPTYNIKRYKLYVLLTLFALGASTAISLALGHLQSVITAFINSFSGETARINSYIFALECFVKNPIFGIGAGNVTAMLKDSLSGYVHSTFFQVLSCAGIVGVLAYAFLYFARIKRLFKNNTLFGFYMFVTFIMFASYAMVDNCEFNVIIIFMTMLITVTGNANEKDNEQSLPLTYNHKNRVLL